MHIVNLASGSKGNSTFVEYGSTKLLIDAGLSERQLQLRLESIGENLKNITAVIITHEHTDHIKALDSLAKKYDIDFYLHKTLVESNFVKADIKEGKLHTFTTEKFNIGELEVEPFETSHDAIAPVGFAVNVSGSKSKFSIITDTGIVFEKAIKTIESSKIVFIESNYDEAMLMGGKYPELLKRRIAGSKGHLSNSQSLSLAKRLYETGTKCFVLSHLSENNNTPEKAYILYADYFESQGLVLDKDVFIRLSHQDRHGNNFLLKEEF